MNQGIIILKHIVIFTADLNFNARWNVALLADEFPDTQFTLFLQTAKKKPGQLIASQFRNLRFHGWRWIPYQTTEILSLLRKKLTPRPARSADRPGQNFTPEALQKNPRIAIRQFARLNSSEACALLKSLSADLGIALSAPILKPELFELPRLGTINLHKGHLPDYRGMPPAFWELKNNEKSVGCTVHRVEAGLDSGDILLAQHIAVDRYSTVSGMQMKLHQLGVNMVIDAVRLISEEKALFTRQPPGGKVYRRPPLAVEQRLRRRLMHNTPAEGLFRSLAKQAVFFCYSDILMPLINRWDGIKGTQKIIILLYHRVSDQFRDNVTIGIEHFDQQMAYLAENFAVVSLQEIVEGRINRHASKPLIAISFDDGYLDNFENAAPILLKHQLPCSFFISTGKITDNTPFEHDLKWLGFGPGNMNWDQVIKMKKWGFQFGSHTQSHVDLAAIDEALARQELSGSLNELRRRLDQDRVYLAYPYGGKRHMTPERLQLAKDSGYSACFSAYGGCNDQHTDLFNIRRIGVNWPFSKLAFKARLKGWEN